MGRGLWSVECSGPMEVLHIHAARAFSRAGEQSGDIVLSYACSQSRERLGGTHCTVAAAYARAMHRRRRLVEEAQCAFEILTFKVA